MNGGSSSTRLKLVWFDKPASTNKTRALPTKPIKPLPVPMETRTHGLWVRVLVGTGTGSLRVT
jgi:hypothetical protein